VTGFHGGRIAGNQSPDLAHAAVGANDLGLHAVDRRHEPSGVLRAVVRLEQQLSPSIRSDVGEPKVPSQIGVDGHEVRRMRRLVRDQRVAAAADGKRGVRSPERGLHGQHDHEPARGVVLTRIRDQ
jgi:hypothetical protein